MQKDMPGFILRRRKSLIAYQIVRRSDREVFRPLTDTQARSYENLARSEVVGFIKRSVAMLLRIRENPYEVLREQQSGLPRQKVGFICMASSRGPSKNGQPHRHSHSREGS